MYIILTIMIKQGFKMTNKRKTNIQFQNDDKNEVIAELSISESSIALIQQTLEMIKNADGLESIRMTLDMDVKINDEVVTGNNAIELNINNEIQVVINSGKDEIKSKPLHVRNFVDMKYQEIADKVVADLRVKLAKFDAVLVEYSLQKGDKQILEDILKEYYNNATPERVVSDYALVNDDFDFNEVIDKKMNRPTVKANNTRSIKSDHDEDAFHEGLSYDDDKEDIEYISHSNGM